MKEEARKISRHQTSRMAFGISRPFPSADVPSATQLVYLNDQRTQAREYRRGNARSPFCPRCLKRPIRLHDYQTARQADASLRAVKSDPEVALIQNACAITEAGFRRACGFVRPGVNEYEVEAEFRPRVSCGAAVIRLQSHYRFGKEFVRAPLRPKIIRSVVTVTSC